MPLDDRARRIVVEFRAWVEAAGAGLGLGAPQRCDREDESTLATRWTAGRHVWHEITVRPFLPQVRVGVVTDDAWRSRDFEQLMEGSDLTLAEFVARGLAAAGLNWADPPVEHYREPGPRYCFATPLDLGAIEQVDSEAFREKVRQILAGYQRAFSPIDEKR